MTAYEGERCTRCHRLVISPDGKTLLEAEVVDDGMVCEDCLTPAEQQAVDEDVQDFMALGEQVAKCPRCGTAVPEELDGEQLEALGWDTPDAADGLWVCPDCHTAADTKELDWVSIVLRLQPGS